MDNPNWKKAWKQARKTIPFYWEKSMIEREKLRNNFKMWYTLTEQPAPAFVSVSDTINCTFDMEVGVLSNKEEETMRTETQEQRNHLTNRLWDIRGEKEDSFQKTFGLVDDPRPSNMKELLERIQKGLYVAPEKPENFCSSDILYHLRWRDPAVKEDQEGYNKAREVMYKAYVTAKDDIQILSPEEGLKTLRAFEAQTFH